MNSTANISSSKMEFLLLTAVQIAYRILKAVFIIQDNRNVNIFSLNTALFYR
jgi:hypothetical protein